VTLNQLLLVFDGELQAQPLGYHLGNFFLHLKHVGHLSVVVLAPQLRTVCHIYQLCANHQTVIRLSDAARENRAHGKFVAGLQRIQLASFVAEHNAAGDYPKFGQS